MVIASVVLKEKLTIHILWEPWFTLGGVFLVNYSIKKNKAQTIAEPEI